MNRIIPVFISMIILLMGCSEGNIKMEREPIVQVALAGSFADDYLVELYPNKNLRLILASHVSFQDETNSFEVDEYGVQTEISLTQGQYEYFLNCVNEFISEDWEKLRFASRDPAPNFCIIAKYGETVKDLDGCLFVDIDENGDYIQTETAHKMMLFLNEILPGQITFVRAPY